MFDIRYSHRLSLNFSTDVMNSARAKIGFSCSNHFRSIVVIVFALITALTNFCFHLTRNKMIKLVLVINYDLEFRLQFDINKKSIFQSFTEILLNNGMRNYIT